MLDFYGVPLNVIALIFSTCGSFCTAMGLILMKIADIKNEKKKEKWVYLQKEWIGGLTFMFCSQVLNGCK